MDDKINIRLPSKQLDEFKTKADALGVPYQVLLRQMVQAFNEDRLIIKQTEKMKDLFQ